MSAAEESAWERWFSLQYDACREVEDAFDKAMKDQPKQMRAALMAALIEHFAERMRMEIELTDPTTADEAIERRHGLVDMGVPPPHPDTRTGPVEFEDYDG